MNERQVGSCFNLSGMHQVGYYLGNYTAAGLVSDIDATQRLVDSGSFILPLEEVYCPLQVERLQVPMTVTTKYLSTINRI